jgi:IS30 family transposase
LSDEERARIAELAATRLPSRLIAKEVGRSHRAVWSYVLRLRQPPPAEGRRSPLRLSLTERKEISRGVAGGESFRAIAGRLGRAPSTVSREVAINGGHSRYRACRADTDALARARRPKPSKLATCERLGAVVEARLARRWSPQQIAGWLPTAFPGDAEMRVSHETIYLSLYVQTRGALRKELTRHLRRRHTTRRPRGHSISNGQGQLRGTAHQPTSRRSPGPGGSGPLGRRPALRQTHDRHRHARRTPQPIRHARRAPNGHSADIVADALARHITALPEQLRRSLTWDQGKEMAAHARFSVATGVPVYFCDPPQPLAARLQREHQRTATPVLPKRSDLAPFSQHDLDTVAAELNERPRQTLGWVTPSQALDKALR